MLADGCKGVKKNVGVHFGSQFRRKSSTTEEQARRDGVPIPQPRAPDANDLMPCLHLPQAVFDHLVSSWWLSFRSLWSLCELGALLKAVSPVFIPQPKKCSLLPRPWPCKELHHVPVSPAAVPSLLWKIIYESKQPSSVASIRHFATAIKKKKLFNVPKFLPRYLPQEVSITMQQCLWGTFKSQAILRVPQPAGRRPPLIKVIVLVTERHALHPEYKVTCSQSP